MISRLVPTLKIALLPARRPGPQLREHMFSARTCIRRAPLPSSRHVAMSDDLAEPVLNIHMRNRLQD